MHSQPPKSSFFKKALFISLGLHACVVAGMYFGRFASFVAEEKPSPTKSIEIILVQANPQTALVNDNNEEKVEFEELVSILDSSEVDGSEVDSEPVESAGYEELKSIAVEDAVSQTEVNESTDSVLEFETNEAQVSGISAAEISNSIGNYMLAYKKELGQSWMDECIKYQNKHGTKNCPEGIEKGSYKDKDPVSRANNYRGNVNSLNLLASISKPGSSAVEELESHYRFLVTEPEQWSMDRPVDAFNPDLSGGVMPLIGFSPSGLRLIGLVDFSFTKGLSWADYSNHKTDFSDLYVIEETIETETAEINPETEKAFTIDAPIFLRP